MKLKAIQIVALAVLSILVVITACSNSSDETPVSATPAVEESRGLPETEFIPYDTPPKPIGGFAAIQQNVVYPLEDEVAGHEGTVVVQAFVDKDGNISKTVIVQSPGFASLEEAAMEALRKSKFEPAQQKGKAVGVYISVPIIFRAKPEKNEDTSRDAQNDKDPEFIPYDSPPQPVGGYGAIAERLKKYNPGPVEGTAIIKTFIDENGKVTKLSILRSCGSEHEDQIAYEVIKNTSFIPAQQRDQEIGVWITIPVVFEK